MKQILLNTVSNFFNLKKKSIVLIFSILSFTAWSQPTILYVGQGSTALNTTPAASNVRYTLNNLGIYKQFRFKSNQTAAANTFSWAFHSGSTGSPDYSVNWRPRSGGNVMSFNTFIPATTFANGALVNFNSGFDGLLPAITSGNYYTFNVDSGSGNSDYAMSVLETSYDPTAFVSQTTTPPLSSNGAGQISVTMANALNAGEYVYMRYATASNFTGSTLIQVPMVGSTGTFYMPCFAANTSIYYYFFSSNKTFAQINSDYSANGNNESVYDMSTLNMLNNFGPNYFYTQPNTVATNFAGIYNIPNTCYPSVLSFVNAINSGTVTGPVIVNVATGYSETAPVGGYVLTATGTAANTITFQKAGVLANPTFTAPTPQTAGGALTDAIFKIQGSDYVTIDGFTMLENNSNTTTAAGTNNMTEFGVAFFYKNLTPADGAQNNTIKNCTIDLNRNYTNSFGIYSNSSTTPTNMGVVANSSGATGANSNLTFVNNIITDVNQGIVVIGATTVAADLNDGLVIGGTATTGNTITNYGTATGSGLVNVSGSMNGVLVRNTKNIVVSYNTISSSPAVTIGATRGIFVDGYGIAPTGTNNFTFNNNIISVKGSGANVNGIEVSSISGTATTVSINNNDFNNFASGGTSNLKFILNSQPATTCSINNNTFTNNTVATTGPVTFIANNWSMNNAGQSKTVNGNAIVTGFTKSGAGGTLYLYNDTTGSSVSGTTHTNNNNNFSNINVTGLTQILGWSNTDGFSAASVPTKTINGNTFSNWAGGTAAITVLDISKVSGVSSVSSNVISNINLPTGIVAPIVIGSIGSATSLDINSNLITNIISGSAGITAISTINQSTIVNINLNEIRTINGVSGSVIGISSGTNTATVNINNNIIDGLKSTGTGSVYNVYGISHTPASVLKVESNSIKNLELTGVANSGALRGITISAASIVTPPIVNLNTVDILTSLSTSASSSTAGLFVSGSANYQITNNTISNITTSSTNASTGSSAAVSGINTGSSGTTQRVNKNTIFNIFNTNGAANSITLVGILTANSTLAGSEIIGNTIYGLKNLATGSNPFSAGYYNGGGGSWTVANNMISIDNLGSTNGMQCSGVFDPGSNGNRRYYYNSIHIGGSSPGTQVSVAFQFNGITATGTAEVKNNIFNMTRTGGGKNYAVANIGSNTTSSVYDFNVYNSVNLSTIGITPGPIDQTFAGWKSTTFADIKSLSDIAVPFVNTAIANLHLVAGNCTDLESGGTPVAITTDFDTTTRNTLTPDIGADEFVGSKPAALIFTAAVAICSGSATGTPINITSSDPTYVYTWSPATGLNTTTGASVIANPATTTTYTVTAISTVLCKRKEVINVTVNPLPAVFSVSPSAATVCPNVIQPLVPSGGIISNNIILKEDFNGLVPGWTKENNSTGGTPANADWSLYLSTPTFRSNDYSDFISSDSDFQGSGGTTATILYSPVFNLSQYSTANLSFYHYFRSLTGDSAKVDVTINGGLTWINLFNFPNTDGAATAFLNKNVSLTPYVGNTNVQIRFKYDASFDYYWNIDNVLITGNTTPTYTWSPTTGLFTDALATIPYTGGATSATLYAKTTTNQTYTVTTNSTYEGCARTSTVPITRTDSSTWAAGAWSPSVPTGTSSLVFNDNYNSTTHLLPATTLNGCSCTVNAGKNVVFDSNHMLKVVNDVSVLGSGLGAGTLTFEDNASLVQTKNTLTNTNTGDITYKRTTTPIRRYDYTYWSTPVQPQTFAGVSPNTLSDKYFEWNPASSVYYWANVASSSLMSPAKGYIIRGPQTYDLVTPATFPATFKGIANNGDYTIAIAYTDATKDFTLIGNPYPSAVSADAFMVDNTSVFGAAGTTMYFWSHNTAVAPSGSQYVYNANDYAVYNYLGGVGTIPPPNSGPGSTNRPNGRIAAGQGFFIRSTQPGTAVFKNSQRMTTSGPGLTGLIPTNDNSDFYKNGTQAKFTNTFEKHRFWMDMSNIQGAFAEILLGYIQNASNDYENGFDGMLEESGENVISFYSTLPGKDLVIQGKALPFANTDLVPLGYKTSIASAFTIKLSDFDGLFTTQNVYLEDKLLNIIHDIKTSPYTFSSAIGTFNNRFVVRYNNALANPDFEQFQNSVLVYSTKNDIKIDSQLENIRNYVIYDVLGRTLATKNAVDAKNSIESNISRTNQALIVKITLDNNQIVTKKIIF